MKPTNYPQINELINHLLVQMQTILGNKLIGLYLDGSLVMGDFDINISDIDLVAILESDINDKEFEDLEKMHVDLIGKYKEWDDRIEVCYISKEALNSTRTKVMPIVNISPGEPFHRTASRKEWLMNWYLLREKNVVIFGPDPKTIIDPISKEEFIQNVQAHVRGWGEWVKTMRNRYAQAYAILTMCRALYAYKKTDQVSKREAAIWVQKELPEWSKLIKDALVWREAGKDARNVNDESTYPNTVRFVEFIRNQILPT